MSSVSMKGPHGATEQEIHCLQKMHGDIGTIDKKLGSHYSE